MNKIYLTKDIAISILRDELKSRTYWDGKDNLYRNVILEYLQSEYNRQNIEEFKNLRQKNSPYMSWKIINEKAKEQYFSISKLAKIAFSEEQNHADYKLLTGAKMENIMDKEDQKRREEVLQDSLIYIYIAVVGTLLSTLLIVRVLMF